MEGAEEKKHQIVTCKDIQKERWVACKTVPNHGTKRMDGTKRLDEKFYQLSFRDKEKFDLSNKEKLIEYLS